jgi:hypothetical protein
VVVRGKRGLGIGIFLSVMAERDLLSRCIVQRNFHLYDGSIYSGARVHELFCVVYCWSTRILLGLAAGLLHKGCTDQVFNKEKSVFSFFFQEAISISRLCLSCNSKRFNFYGSTST